MKMKDVKEYKTNLKTRYFWWYNHGMYVEIFLYQENENKNTDEWQQKDIQRDNTVCVMK